MIGIAGAGAFGTALAAAFGQRGPVTLWMRDKNAAVEIATTRRNKKYLPEATLSDNVRVTSDVADLQTCDVVLLCIPTQRLRGFLETYGQVVRQSSLVNCSKGAELNTGLSPTGIVRDCLPDAATAVLTGPSFARDVAKNLPTALCLAAREPELQHDLQNRLALPHIRVYRTDDVIGAELGGALKNVVAIACGASVGAGLGESARAALLTRGFAEMARLALARGARLETLTGLSGLGDLVLTCGSEQSRNFRLGLTLGLDEDFDSTITVEGAATARALAQNPDLKDIHLPIVRVVAALVSGDLKVPEAIDRLLARPLREE